MGNRILVTISEADIAWHLMKNEDVFTRVLESLADDVDVHVSDLADAIARYARRDDAKDITDFLRNLAEKIEKAAG